MGVPVKKDDKIPLSLQLSTEVTTAFVEANLFDDTKTELGASPVTLTHDADGHYINSAVDFPLSSLVFVIYRVWTDGTKTARHPLHCDTIEDIFPRDIPSEKLENLNIDDFNKLLSGVQGEFTATTEAQDLRAQIESDNISSANIEDSELSATIDIKDLTGGSNESNEFSASVE